MTSYVGQWDCRAGMERGQTDACRIVRSDCVADVRRSVAVTERSLTVGRRRQWRRRRLVGETDRLAASATSRHAAEVPGQVAGRRLSSP